MYIYIYIGEELRLPRGRAPQGALPGNNDVDSYNDNHSNNSNHMFD